MLPISDRLTRERNREAADRTLLAWIRTTLALIGFGFGVSKFARYMESAYPDIIIDPNKGGLIVGGAFMVLGTVGLLVAIIQHWQTISCLNRGEFPDPPSWPLVRAVAVGLLIIGLITIVELLF